MCNSIIKALPRHVFTIICTLFTVRGERTQEKGREGKENKRGKRRRRKDKT
jgi:hypothetical protein